MPLPFALALALVAVSIRGDTVAGKYDRWTCAADVPQWHTLREAARYVMYEDGSPVRTSADRIQGLIPVWLAQTSANVDPMRLSSAAPCPVGEAFLMLLDFFLAGVTSVKGGGHLEIRVLLRILDFLENRVPVSGIVRSTWPIFGLLLVTQQSLMGLGSDNNKVRFKGLERFATPCQAGTELFEHIVQWLAASATTMFLASLVDARAAASDLVWELAQNPALCGEDGEMAILAAQLILALSNIQDGPGLPDNPKLDVAFDLPFEGVQFSKMFFTSWPILSILHRVQEAQFREKDCADAAPGAYALLSRARPVSVWICVRRQSDMVDERWRIQGVFEDCVNIVSEIHNIGCSDCLFVDVGANFGSCSLGVARLGYPVLAFEPVPLVAGLFKAAVKRNHVGHMVTVIEAAVGRTANSHGLLHCLDWHSAYCKVFAPDSEPVASADGSDSQIAVRSVSLDSVLSHSTPGQRVGAIKIDVEGAEEEVVRGGANFLAMFRPLLFLELHPVELRERGSTPETVFDTLLQEVGYTGARPLSNASGSQCNSHVNGVYANAAWEVADFLNEVDGVDNSCVCADRCNERVLLEGCRCWNFDKASRTCTLLRRCVRRNTRTDDKETMIWAGELHGLWKLWSL